MSLYEKEGKELEAGKAGWAGAGRAGSPPFPALCLAFLPVLPACLLAACLLACTWQDWLALVLHTAFSSSQGENHPISA